MGKGVRARLAIGAGVLLPCVTACGLLVGFDELQRVNQSGTAAPADDSGGVAGNANISLGAKHSCAIMGDETLRCWGLNDRGQLGIGSTENKSVPVAVPSLSNVVFVSLGERHTCAVLSNGNVFCWGSNEFAQLGTGSADVEPHEMPARVESSPAKKVQAGKGHTCIETLTKTVECWGANQHGQLGDGTTGQKTTPTRVSSLTGVEKLSTGNGDFSCAVAQNADGGGDAVYCWGVNDKGQLGQPLTVPSSPIPLLVPGVVDPDKVWVGREHACATLPNNTISCWGANSHGQLGDGTFANRTTPVTVIGVVGMSEVSPGFGHTCGNEETSGLAKCWGSNEFGQVGNGKIGGDQPQPQALSGRGWEAITTDGEHSCGRRDGNYCWGRNDFGQLGNGTTKNTGTPTRVAF